MIKAIVWAPIRTKRFEWSVYFGVFLLSSWVLWCVLEWGCCFFCTCNVLGAEASLNSDSVTLIIKTKNRRPAKPASRKVPPNGNRQMVTFKNRLRSHNVVILQSPLWEMRHFLSVRPHITAMWTPLTRKRGCGLVVAPLVKARERTAEVARGFESHARRFFGASSWGSDKLEKLTKTTKINANPYFIFRSFGDGENRPRGFLK